MSLRKYLRTRKLIAIKQLGVDRVVDFVFRTGETECHLLVELYASGNLILTDGDYTIIALLRTHKFDEKVKCAVKEKYPFAQAAHLTIGDFAGLKLTEENLGEEYKKSLEQRSNEEEDKKGKKKKKDKKTTLKVALQVFVPFINFTEVEHMILSVDGNPNEVFDESQYAVILKAIKYCYSFINELQNKGEAMKGYLYYKILKPQTPPELTIDTTTKEEVLKEAKVKEDKNESKEEEKEGIKIYDEVEPYEFLQFKGREKEEANSFDEALDIYFTAKEKEKEQTKQINREAEIWKKMQKIKEDQESRIKSLQEGQENFLKRAKLIEEYITEIDAIIKIINTMIKAGVKWADIWKNIKDEKKRGNVFANLIHKLDLLNGTVAVMLNPKDEEENSEAPTELVNIDIKLTAYQNFEKYYNEKKKSAVKENKTKDAAQMAIKVAEKTAIKELMIEKQKIENLQKIRKIFWFEKYNWFITSENYLVLSGRSAQENEFLVKRYLKKGDLFIHANTHGAAATILKNPTGNAVSPISLNEAGMYCVCRSSAWEQKLISEAYWVHDHQVSKTAPSGEYLQTGSFMIRGKKNYVRPSKLEMGFTYLFCLDEMSIPNHINDRKIRVADLGVQEQEDESGSDSPVEDNKIETKVEEKRKKEQKPNKKPTKPVEVKAEVKKEEKKKQISKHKQKKIKKMKEKYGELDEDERELVLKLIGVLLDLTVVQRLRC
jgi:predicted ribosome quality control (RQC) complex YloA/Tae2 family protein